MQALDVKTLSAVSLLTSLLLPLVLLSIGQMTRHSHATRAWTRGVWLYSLGFLGVALRNVIPDFASIVVANCLFVAGYGELWNGLRYFFGRPVSRRWMVWLLLPFTAVFVLFMTGPGTQEIRIIASSVVMCGLSLAIAREFYRAAERALREQHHSSTAERRMLLVFCGVFVFSGLAMGARGVIIIVVRPGLDSTLLNQVAFVSYLIAIFTNFMLASCLPLLVSRRIQGELFASEASLLKAQELGGLGTLVADLHTKTLTTNRVVNRMLGLSDQQTLSKEVWQSMLHPDDRERSIQALEAMASGHTQGTRNEYRIQRPDNGQTRWLSVSSEISTDPLSGEKALMSTLRDITELKLSELAAVQARQAADQANNAKSNFLANMSHEIRTPMNAILGLLHLLQTTELTARQRDYASKTEGAAQSLLGLLNDILDFSKVEAGKMTLESEPFALELLLRNLAVVLSANVGSRDVEVLFDVDPGLPAVLRGDAMRLQQVLINLGGNAIKFTPRGQVVLALRKRGATADAVTMGFSVQDSGIGIAPQHQAYIFSGFSQAESSTTRRFGGTGLGLAISQRLVNMMGGSIALDSTEGVGSTFSFVLTLPIVTGVLAQGAAPEPAPMDPQRVLVVDDNPMAGALMARMVRSWGWEAELADSGPRALEWITRQHARSPQQFAFPVIFMDWQMPQMDGWETTGQLRQFAAQHQLPPPTVIMVTAHGREALAQRSATEQGMLSGLLVKPVTGAMLREAVVQARSADAGVRQLTQGRSSQRRLRGMRILVVEDNLINQQVAEELLGNEGALVSLASNGQLGVEAVAAAAPQFDAVLMDLQMPVLDGYGATQAIRQQLGLTQLPIIAMTANALDSDRVACLAAGMSEHIGKPFEVDKLVALLLRLTDSRGDAGFHDAPAREPAGTADTPALPEVAGLDLVTAVGRMAGMRALYLRTARDFSALLEALIPELQGLLAAGALQPVLRQLHTLKGNAATLGATELAAKAMALEVLCNTPGGLQACAAQLGDLATCIASTQHSLAQAITQLSAATTATTATPSAGATGTPQALHAVRELHALAVAQDLQVLQRFAELNGSLADLPHGFCDQLDAALQNLDMDVAQSLCSAMLVDMAAAALPPIHPEK